jgi:hypothetical protein
MSKVTERSRLDKDKKERIIFLATQGLMYDEIAKEVGCQTNQVSGYLRTAANFHKIPKELASAGSTHAARKAENKSRQKQGLPLLPIPGQPGLVQVSQEPVVSSSAPEVQASAPAPVQADELKIQPAEQGVQILEASGEEQSAPPPQAVETEELEQEPVSSPVLDDAQAAEVMAPAVDPVPVEAPAPVQVPESVQQVVPPPVAAEPVVQKEIKVPVSVPLPVPPVVKGPVSLPERKMVLPSAPAPVPPGQQAQLAPPAASPDGWGGGRHVPGYVGGFQNVAASMRYQVERKIPADGIVGHHTGSFTEADLCNLYGEGFYRILRFEPGRALPIEHEVKVAASFGPPRSPKFSVSGQPAQGNRFLRNAQEEDGQAPQAPRYERPDYRERSLYEFARNQQQAQASVGNDVTAEAIRQLGEANKRAQEQVEASRKSGPDAFVQNFFQSQNDLMYKRAEDEKKGAEQRRKDDDEKWERRQREVEQEHRRRQEEEEKRHTRDLERIRYESESRQKAAENERKLMMDLEDKKLALIREEAKLRQDILQQELQANREAMKELQESTATQVEAVKDAMKRELEKDREGLEREHKIREKSLDKEHELSSKILDIKQESLQKQGGDQIFNLLDTVVKEFGKGLNQIVELNKLQAMTPEAQAASVAGRSMGGETRQEARATAAAPEAQASQVEVQGSSEASAPQEEGRDRMETIVQVMVEQPTFKQVLKEWSRQVKSGEDPTAFSGMFLDWLQDPSDMQARKGCSMFVNFIKTRTWDEVFAVIGPKLDRDVLAAFKSEHAADFYEGFKAIVVEHVKMYFEDFLNSRKQAQEAQAPAAPAVEPEPAAPVAESVQEEVSEEEAEAQAVADAVPVPTRANLRPVK